MNEWVTEYVNKWKKAFLRLAGSPVPPQKGGGAHIRTSACFLLCLSELEEAPASLSDPFSWVLGKSSVLWLPFPCFLLLFDAPVLLTCWLFPSLQLLLLFSRSVVSDSLWPHGLQHARLPLPSPSPCVCSNSCPLSRWCHPTISSSVPFSTCLQSFPASGSFPISQLFASGGQTVLCSNSSLPSLYTRACTRTRAHTHIQTHTGKCPQLYLMEWLLFSVNQDLELGLLLLQEHGSSTGQATLTGLPGIAMILTAKRVQWAQTLPETRIGAAVPGRAPKGLGVPAGCVLWPLPCNPPELEAQAPVHTCLQDQPLP